MKTMSQYMYENRSPETINEWLGLGNLVKLFKRIFMPWTDEAIDFYKRTWRKNIWESVNESVDGLEKCKRVFSRKYGNITVDLYDCHKNRDFAMKLLDDILKYKEKPNIIALEETPSKKNTGFVMNIYIDTPANGLYGLFSEGQNGKLSCLVNFIVDSSDSPKISSALKSSLQNILADCLKQLK